MAQISYEDVVTSNNNSGGNYKVGFFTLKNNGDEAIVRIMHDTVQTFDIYQVHNIKINGNDRKINCLRDAHDPIDKCPLCAANVPIQQRIFIHLIEYTPNADGTVTASAKVWDRSASQYAPILKNLINEYGPLSDCIFKIKRNGQTGSTDTTYTIMYAPPQVYNPQVYVKDDTLFDDYSALGGVILNKSVQDIVAFQQTGQFPMTQQNNTATAYVTPATPPTPSVTHDTYGTPGFDINSAQGQQIYNSQQNGFDSNGIPVWNTASASVSNVGTGAPPSNVTPWDNAQQTVQKPVRTY